MMSVLRTKKETLECTDIVEDISILKDVECVEDKGGNIRG
jgi:hypothetical protein